MGEADRAGVDVGLLAEGELTAAEHLRLGRQLDMDLKADHRLQLRHPDLRGLASKPIARSSA